MPVLRHIQGMQLRSERTSIKYNTFRTDLFMIHESELMVNDIVEYTNQGVACYCRITSIGKGMVLLRTLKGKGEYVAKLEDIRPVTLMPVMLEKNGFDISDGEVARYTFEEDGQRFHFSLRRMYNKNDGKPNGYSFFVCGVLTIFDYVHEVQRALRTARLRDLADNFII